MAAAMPKIAVLLTDAEEFRFSGYCREHGFKKSTLIARLIRDHLDNEGYAAQAPLDLGDAIAVGRRRQSGKPKRR